MSIFPPTRIGRALVASAVLVGVAKIVPFLLQVTSMTGDERTELPPLTPTGTTREFLLGNPVTWFLAVAAGVYVALVVVDVVVALVRPRPARARRTTAARSRTTRTARRPATTARTASTPRPRSGSQAAATSPARRPASPRTTQSRTTQPRTTQPRTAAARSAGTRPRTSAQQARTPSSRRRAS